MYKILFATKSVSYTLSVSFLSARFAPRSKTRRLDHVRGSREALHEVPRGRVAQEPRERGPEVRGASVATPISRGVERASRRVDGVEASQTPSTLQQQVQVDF